MHTFTTAWHFLNLFVIGIWSIVILTEKNEKKHILPDIFGSNSYEIKINLCRITV